MSESKIKKTNLFFKTVLLGVLLCFGFSAHASSGALGLEAVAQELIASFLSERVFRPAPESAKFGAYLAGSFAKSQSDFKRAAAYHRTALENDRSHEDLINSLYALYVMDGQIEKSIPYAHQALSLGKDITFPALTLFVDGVKNGDKKEALSYLEKVPSEGYLHYLKALCRAWLLAGEKKTEEAYKEVGIVKDLPTTALFHQALMAYGSGDVQKTSQLFEKVLKQTDAKNAQVLSYIKGFYDQNPNLKVPTELGKLYGEVQSESFVARELLEKAPQKVFPVDVGQGVALSLFDMAGFLQNAGDRDTALFLTRLASYLEPQNAVITFFEAEVLESMRLYDNANAVYKKATINDALYYSKKVRHAMNLLSQKKPKEAASVLETEMNKGTKYPIFYMTLGDAYRDMALYEKALEMYDRSLAALGEPIQVEAAPLHFSKGVCFEKLGQSDNALKSLSIAAQLVPDNPVYLNYVGYMWLETNQRQEEALEVIKRASAKIPEDGNILDSLGWAYFQLGRYEEALPVLEKAVMLEAGNAEINAHLGDLYWRLGRKREARFQWNHAMILKKGSSEKLLESLKEKIENGLPDKQPEEKNG